MNDSMMEYERPTQAKVERSPSLDNILTASDIVVSESFRNLVSEKARQVVKVVRKNLGKASLSAAGVSMILSSGCGNTENLPTPTGMPESIPASAPITPLPKTTEISMPNIPTQDTFVDIRKTSKAEKEFIDSMKSKYGLEVTLHLTLPGADKAIFGAQTLTEDEVREIERGINLMPYCPDKFYKKLILGKVPEEEKATLGFAQYPFNYIELVIRGNKNYTRELLNAKSFSTQEGLGRILAHECGYMISHRVMHLSVVDDYPDTEDGKRNFFRDMYSSIPENKNPLYVILSELTSWQFDGVRYNKVGVDPRIKDKHYGSMDEFFAEMLAMYKYRQDLLTEREFTFFNNFESGVSEEGDNFLKRVVENPKILLENQFNS